MSVYTDRAGRLWRIAETCTRCAALIPDCQVLAAAVPPAREPNRAHRPRAGYRTAERRGGRAGCGHGGLLRHPSRKHQCRVIWR
ncbi:hypothetical protein [Streptacidiphilus sp. PAMC 29251]